ncbi:penicillin-binding protein 2 [Sulfurimonas sp. HSL-1716]|uniref:penicillin-binding protein 2 n=1 Tax=Hydrocurvibacter sulfurireducens TaxID=3131937 RepID=UPI0031F9E2B5
MRLKIILLIFAVAWISLIVRVFYLAIQHNEYYEDLSDKNTIKTELISPVRGEILDRNNNPVAINKLGFKIEIAPHLSSEKNMPILDDELDTLVKYIPSLDKEKMKKEYMKQDSYYNQNYIEVASFISYKDIMPVYSILNLRDNIHIISSPKRFYPYNDTASHIIGYVSNANQNDIDRDPLLSIIGSVGKNGIERYYNTFLEGEAGERKVKVSAKNEEIQELYHKNPIENRKLILSIDMNLQKYISDMFKNESGAVIVMDVNGSVLAAGSFPEYDLNTFVSGISTERWKQLIEDIDAPFTNKLINGLYPPGSVVKIGLGLIFITTALNERWGVNCTGSYIVSNRNFRCWKKEGHGRTDIRKAIRESCDDYFYKASVNTGIETMSKGMLRYGLGEKTGIDLPNEFIGTVPSREWKRKKYNQPWYIGETLNTAIGQGDFLVTPMQVAQLTALIATGKLVTPHIAKKIGNKEVKPVFKDVLNEIEKKKINIIRQGMYDVCNADHGTATPFLHTKIRLAGKTGTAQVVGISQETKKRLQEHEMKYYTRSHAWLTTYGPYKNPQYVVTVLVEHGGHGGHAAGDIVSKIYNKLLQDGYIKK